MIKMEDYIHYYISIVAIVLLVALVGVVSTFSSPKTTIQHQNMPNDYGDSDLSGAAIGALGSKFLLQEAENLEGVYEYPDKLEKEIALAEQRLADARQAVELAIQNYEYSKSQLKSLEIDIATLEAALKETKEKIVAAEKVLLKAEEAGDKEAYIAAKAEYEDLNEFLVILTEKYDYTQTELEKASLSFEKAKLNLDAANEEYADAEEALYALQQQYQSENCVDSDNGLDFTTKGYVILGSIDDRFWDDCEDDRENRVSYVIEQYCDNNNNRATMMHPCDLGCYNGACITQNYDDEQDDDNGETGDDNDNDDDSGGSSKRDRDRDGVPDSTDNCPDDYNPSQKDSDGDGIGDVCDDDYENIQIAQQQTTGHLPGSDDDTETTVDKRLNAPSIGGTELRCIEGSKLSYLSFATKTIPCDTKTFRAIIDFLHNGGYSDEKIFGMIWDSEDYFTKPNLWYNEKGYKLVVRGDQAFGGNIADLSSAEELYHLQLFNSKSVVGNIQNLENLKNLRFLSLSYTATWGDIASFSSLTMIEELYAHHTALSGDIQSLAGFSGVRVLWFERTSVTGMLSSISGIKTLEYVNLENTGVYGSSADLAANVKLEI